MYKLYIYGKTNHNRRLTVRDELGQIRYLIDDTRKNNNNLLILSKVNGEVILKARQVRFSPFPIFHLFKGSKKIGSLRKHPGIFGVREAFFSLHPHDWVITGDFIEFDLVVHHKNDLIMKCEKIFIDDYDLFELQLKNDDNIPLHSIIAVLLDHYSRERVEDIETQSIHEEGYDFGLLNNIKLSPPTQKNNLYKIKSR